jgi:hypothetical protein
MDMTKSVQSRIAGVTTSFGMRHLPFNAAWMRRFALKSSEFRAIFALNSRGSDNLLMISDGL